MSNSKFKPAQNAFIKLQVVIKLKIELKLLVGFFVYKETFQTKSVGQLKEFSEFWPNINTVICWFLPSHSFGEEISKKKEDITYLLHVFFPHFSLSILRVFLTLNFFFLYELNLKKCVSWTVVVVGGGKSVFSCQNCLSL